MFLSNAAGDSNVDWRGARLTRPRDLSTGAAMMVVRVATVAFVGIEARPVDVQVQISNGNVVFTVVGLGDKAVAESRERVRAALNAAGLACRPNGSP